MNNLDTYTWKLKKISRDPNIKQGKIRLVDMSENELNVAYAHCKQMLYNQDQKSLGRILVLDEISKTLDKCGAELALRWFLQQKDNDGNFIYSDIKLLSDLRTWKSSVGDSSGLYRLQDFIKVHPDYMNVPIDLVIQACRDSLGMFNHSKITLKFLYRLGIYFTSEELEYLKELTVNNTIDEMTSIIKLRLDLPEDAPLVINDKGLNEKEFTDMIHLKHFKGKISCKYSDLTTDQLKTLRHKVLFALEDEVLKQINLWKMLMSQITEVAEFKNYKLY